jgi:uncharacterized DUF497 family protein
MTFEWDDNKNEENIVKHNVSFYEAQKAFADPNLIIIPDTKHSLIEDRYFCIGKTGNDIVTVRFTKRNNNIRILGAGVWRKQRRIYESKNNI